MAPRVYHLQPADMRGSVLYPLNALAGMYPEVYETARRKYESRERLLGIRVPVLDVLWNDVVHTAPIHP